MEYQNLQILKVDNLSVEEFFYLFPQKKWSENKEIDARLEMVNGESTNDTQHLTSLWRKKGTTFSTILRL